MALSRLVHGGTVVRWTDVVIFVTVSWGMAWLVCLPLWLDPKGLQSAHAWWVLPLMMYTPTVAVAIVMWRTRPATFRAAVSRLGMMPLRPVGRTIGFAVGAIFLLIGTVAAGIGVAALCGFAKLDLIQFSGYAELLPEAAQKAAPIGVFVAVQVALLPVAAVFNGVLAFGEELGWRGWLLPALQPLGVWKAIPLVGVVWGIWHSPVILLGYNFDQPNPAGLLLMTTGCIAVGMLLGLLRIWSGSLWPCVFGHGAFNAAGGLIALLSNVSTPPNPALAGPLGVGTWVAASAFVVIVLFAQRRRRAVRTGS